MEEQDQKQDVTLLDRIGNHGVHGLLLLLEGAALSY